MRRWAWVLVWVAGCQCLPARPNDGGIDDGGPTSAALGFNLEDFGTVLRGDAVERTGTFSNTSAQAVEVSELTVTGPSFSLLGASSLIVPAGSELTTRVRFAPASLGPQGGALTFRTSVSAEVQTTLLTGSGVGPALQLTPDRIDLGTIPLYAGVPATASTPLTVGNAGLDGVPPLPAAALQLFFDVLSTSAAAPGELCVGDCLGRPLHLEAGGTSVIPVTVTTTSPGLKTWDVRLFSNDPTAPLKTIPAQVEVVARPTCHFAVPARLAFGVLTSPESRDLEVVLKNVGNEVCEVSSVGLGAETPAQQPALFSVVNAPSGLQTIAPGGVLRLTVRAWAQGAVPPAPLTVSSELLLSVNHPDGFARVALSADLELSCLSVTPSPLDFGTVQTGCRSADRAVTLRNRCTHKLTVTSASLGAFSSFSASAVLPQTLEAGEATQLATRFAPVALGLERGALEIGWLDGAVAKTTTLPLLGNANATGLNTDLFPPVGNKLDLLLAIDDSCSMDDKVARLNAQLPHLLTALQHHHVDFHLAVVVAAWLDSSRTGAFRQTSTGARWLTPSTPDLAARFTELTAHTGTSYNASCEEPVLAALTAPRASDPLLNGGFLRADAALGVVCISDFTDTASRLPELLQIKGPGGRFRWDSISAAGPWTPQCDVLWTPRPDDVTAAGATGGTLLDVCASDWSLLLESVAASSSDARTFFPLRARPDPLGAHGLSVELSGQPVSSTTDAGMAVWSWESEPNAVRFSALYGPAATDSVSVSYSVACVP